MNTKKVFLLACLFFLSGCTLKQTLQSEPKRVEEQTISVFLIALDDNGLSGKKIGCNDSVVPIKKTISSNADLIESALSNLLSIKDQYYGESGLYNSLYQSDLKIEKININDNTADVYLSGTYSLGGSCDDPRFESQIRETILQFPEIENTNIFINGTNLEKLSDKGL